MENNFDKIFKDKLEHREFEMKPEYWKGAEALIEADESSRDWRRFFVWFGVAMIVGLVVFFAWENDASNELVENEKISNTTLENVLPKSIENSKAAGEVFDKEKLVVGESTFENNLLSKKEEINIPVNVLLEESNPSKVEGYNSNKSLSSKVVNSNLSDSNQSEFSKTIPNSETKDKEEDGINTNELNSNSNGNNNSNDNTFTKNNINENNPIITLNDEGKNESEIPSLSKKDTENNEENSTVEKIAVQPIASNATILLPFLEMFLASNKKIEELDLNTVWFNNPSRKKYAFGIYGGAVGYPLKEKNSDNSFIGFKTGLLFEHNFQIGKANMAVGTELTYHHRSGNFVNTKQNEVAKYSFGRSIAQARLTPKNLHYFELPLYLKYQKKRMTFETGASFNYLLGVRGKVVEANLTEKSGWIPSLGFKKNHVNILLGFHYRISDNLHLGVRANYTPSGILDSNAELPEGITVALQESRPLYLTVRVTQYLKFKK